MSDLPWELSQISKRVRARHRRHKTRRLLGRGRLTEYLGAPCPYFSVAMSDFNGRNDWRAPSRNHRIPRSRGGSNVFSTSTVVCHRCNQEKGSLTREEFLQMALHSRP